MHKKIKSDSPEITEIGILPGYRCDFNCAHCSIGYKRNTVLSDAEMKLIAETITQHGIKSLIFAGGEPTLHIPIINRLFRKLNSPERLFITVTTNGSFAGSLAKAETVLRKFSFLNKIQLSYDKWHEKFLPFENVKHLFLACKKTGVDFCVLMAIESPLDLHLAAKLGEISDFKIAIQKVVAAGNAERAGIYYKFPSFDDSVLTQRCANLKKPVYLCRRGFALYDINLSFTALNATADQKIFSSFDDLLKSEFYMLMQNHTFGELLNKFKIDSTKLLPSHSMPCNLCGYIGGQLRARTSG